MTINHKKFYNIGPRRLVHFTTLLRNIRLGCMATTDALAYYQKVYIQQKRFLLQLTLKLVEIWSQFVQNRPQNVYSSNLLPTAIIPLFNDKSLKENEPNTKKNLKTKVLETV